jgi:ribosomal protein S12 methylthiotransferase accessory factor
MDVRWFDPRRLLPLGAELDPDRVINWVLGLGLVSRLPVLVPRDIVRMDGLAPDLPGICQHTNGLASGNSEDEAVFHACCELIERDAVTLWSMFPDGGRQRRIVDPGRFGSAEIDDLVTSIARASLRLTLFDITSDIEIPTFRAIIGTDRAQRHFDVAEGTGTHPVAVRAAARAITEAAQSRLTAIAGARDDIDGAHYGATAPLAAPPCEELIAPPRGLEFGSDLPAALACVIRSLTSAGTAEPIIVNLGGESYGISVVRALSSDLEDREANSNWRPGSRAVTALLERVG